MGLGFPERFAEGAARGNPLNFIKFLAMGCDGHLTATVDSPPVTQRGTLWDLGSIMVRGPGQNSSASFFAVSGTSLTRS